MDPFSRRIPIVLNPLGVGRYPNPQVTCGVPYPCLWVGVQVGMGINKGAHGLPMSITSVQVQVRRFSRTGPRQPYHVACAGSSDWLARVPTCSIEYLTTEFKFLSALLSGDAL